MWVSCDFLCQQDLITFQKFQKQPPDVFCRKKVFLEISKNSLENTCARVTFLIKLQAEDWGDWGDAFWNLLWSFKYMKLH